MSTFYFSQPLDNLMRTAATVTIDTGAAVTGYPIANLSNGNPAQPLKIAGTAVDIVMNWASPVLPIFPAILNSNLDVAAQLQGHTSDAWGTPDVDITFGIPTVSTDGWYTNPWKDLTSSSAKAWWRLHITGAALPIILGELWLGSTLRTLGTGVHLLLGGGMIVSDVKTVTHETAYGVELTYEQGPRREAYQGTLLLTAAQLTTLQTWAQATRLNARPMIVVPDSDVDDAWYVKLSQAVLSRNPQTFGLNAQGLYMVDFGFKMVSRGLPWIDPDA